MKRHSFHGAECAICKKGIKVNNRSKRSICFHCNNKTPPDEYRCQGITKQQKRCGQWAKVDGGFCHFHIPKEGNE